MSSHPSLHVGLGQLLAGSEKGKIYCPDIGSTVALAAYDPLTKSGAVAHVVLPQGNDQEFAARYANLAPQALLSALNSPDFSQVRFAFVGGSQVIHGAGGDNWADLGARNVSALQRELDQKHCQVVANDTGGSCGRCLSLNLETGAVEVTTFAKGLLVLCELAMQQEAA